MSIVLFVHQSSEMYGSDKVLFLLVDEFKRGGKFYPVVVLPGPGPLYDALLNCGVEVHLGEVAKISRSIFSPIGIFKLLWKAFIAVRFLDKVVGNRDIAVVHSNTLAVLSGALWSFFRKKKHLWHVHEIILSPVLVSKAFPRLIYFFSDKVISNSTLTENWLLSVEPKLKSRSVVVMNGLPLIERPSDIIVEDFRKNIGAKLDSVLVTLAGRINRMKGQGLLLEAMANLKGRGLANSIIVLIVGGAAPGQEDLPVKLMEQAKLLGVSECCRFIPFVDDIWPIWFATDIAVVPSTEPESFGMVAIEAMSAEVPVIASAHGGVLDIVVHEETGLLVPPCDSVALADAIGCLSSDGVLRRTFGEAGARRQSIFFSVDSQVRQIGSVYDEMIG